MQSLHEAMSMPIVMKSIAGKIGSVGRSTVEIQNDYNFLARNRNDDPAGIRWINSDLIGFTYK